MEPSYHYVRGQGWVPFEANPTDNADVYHMMEGSSPEKYWYIQGVTGWCPLRLVDAIPNQNYKVEVWCCSPNLSLSYKWVPQFFDNRTFNGEAARDEVRRFATWLSHQPEWRIRLIPVAE